MHAISVWFWSQKQTPTQMLATAALRDSLDIYLEKRMANQKQQRSVVKVASSDFLGCGADLIVWQNARVHSTSRL
eukprot:5299063-Amphidinium_carterae.1